jgi:hypothetical protein
LRQCFSMTCPKRQNAKPKKKRSGAADDVKEEPCRTIPIFQLI